VYCQFEDKSNTCNLILKYMSFGDEQFDETVSGCCSIVAFYEHKDSSRDFIIAE
jgi:hypothetical protein